MLSARIITLHNEMLRKAVLDVFVSWRVWHIIRPALLPVGTVSFMILLGFGAVFPSWAPEKNLVQDALTDEPIDSLEDLYALRDRLLDNTPIASSPARLVSATVHDSFNTTVDRQRILRTIQAQLYIETRAEAHWHNAERLEHQARFRQRMPRRLIHIEQSQQLWLAAIEQLQQIPSDSLLASAAGQKITEYQQQLLRDVYRRDAIRSSFLVSIAKQTRLNINHIHITVCTLDGLECHRLNGDRPPTSAASLIKVPVAVALMQKLDDRGLDPETSLYIHPDNHTEDASELFVDGEFAMQTVVGRMIDQSSNIALNQLIDYLGFDYINDVLDARELDGISVGSKLMGDRIEPKRMGKGKNRITTDAMTQLMADIYQQSLPGHALLINALSTQTDMRMAQTALDKDDITWIGEKTGWNSQMIGSTVAAIIDDKQYVMTVALDEAIDYQTMQDIIEAIADHILENDGF